MVISHKNKYVFVELPLTGSTAISKELRENYDGELMLYKHATYLDFLKVATEEEKKYFVFSCIRNPLGRAISHYHKYKNDHDSRYTSKEKLDKRKGFYQTLCKFVDLARFKYIKKTGADFPSYFRKFYMIPYDNWSRLSHHNFDYVIRFERIQEEFLCVLDLLGLEQKRPLPTVNKTDLRSKDISKYFTPDTIDRAKWIFGPFMQKWGYQFPPEWGEIKVSWIRKFEFEALGAFRTFIWKFLRKKK